MDFGLIAAFVALVAAGLAYLALRRLGKLEHRLRAMVRNVERRTERRAERRARTTGRGLARLTRIAAPQRLLPAARREAGRSPGMRRTGDFQADLARAMDRSFWPQVEAIITLYRIIDGLPTLPSTRRWAASPDFLLHLVHHVRRHRPKVVVECGAGASTITLAFALAADADARLYSIENHPQFAREVETQLAERGLADRVTVIVAPLSERRYPDFDHSFHWYDLSNAVLPERIDMLVVDGPYGQLNRDARYPAGPELLDRMARHGHIFVDDALREDEARLGWLWRALYPDLGVRELRAEKGAFEMFFLDDKIRRFLPPAET